MTWVAEDGVISGKYDDGDPDHPDAYSFKQADQEEDSVRLTKSAADFSQRIQAVAKREAEALVDKVIPAAGFVPLWYWLAIKREDSSVFYTLTGARSAKFDYSFLTKPCERGWFKGMMCSKDMESTLTPLDVDQNCIFDHFV